jgi:hypothetical protein
VATTQTPVNEQSCSARGLLSDWPVCTVCSISRRARNIGHVEGNIRRLCAAFARAAITNMTDTPPRRPTSCQFRRATIIGASLCAQLTQFHKVALRGVLRAWDGRSRSKGITGHIFRVRAFNSLQVCYNGFRDMFKGVRAF